MQKEEIVQRITQLKQERKGLLEIVWRINGAIQENQRWFKRLQENDKSDEK